MTNKWSKDVTESSSAMDVPKGTFEKSAPEIAQALKTAAIEREGVEKNNFQSAMSMLDFYINRGGKNLTEQDKSRLNQAKIELRKLFDREAK